MSGEHSTSEWFSVSRFGIFILLTQLFLPRLSAQSHPKAVDLLRQMTLEEKVAQLSQLPGFPVAEWVEQVGTSTPGRYFAQIWRGLGSVGFRS